jgi:hypothetical protein
VLLGFESGDTNLEAVMESRLAREATLCWK